MEISKLKSNLRMSGLYFSDCSIRRSEEVGSGGYTADLEGAIEALGEHQFRVELKLIVEKEDFSLAVVANAHFSYEADDYGMEEDIVKKNTVAIMFPFIRSQVSLLTTQPGMVPIVLPPINTAKFSFSEEA